MAGKRGDAAEAYAKARKRGRVPQVREVKTEKEHPFHISLYIDRGAYDEIKRTAIEHGVRPHAVLMDALKAGLLSEYALNYDAIAGSG